MLLLKLLVFCQVTFYARLFAPEEIRQLATVMLIVSFAIILTRMGLNESLIRDQHPDQSLLDSAFTPSLLVGLGLWLSVFLSAPLFAALFEQPQLTEQLRVLSLLVFGTTLGLLNQIWIKKF
jgi:O-antigen/teichoic acid export membrane protein